SVTSANGCLGVGRPRDANARAKRSNVVVLEPPIGLHKRDWTLRAVDGEIRNQGLRLVIRCWIVLPTHSGIQGQVGAQLPLVLYVGIILVRPRMHRGVFRRLINVGAEISNVALAYKRGDSGPLHDCLLQAVDIGGGGPCRRVASDDRRDIREAALPRALVEEDAGRKDRAAEEAAAVVVHVEAEIDPGAEGMRSMN